MIEYGRIHTDGSRSGGQPVLLPCPFCGSLPKSGDSTYGYWLIFCSDENNCLAQPSVELKTEAEAIAAWNTRQPTQSDVLQADALDFGNELIFACAGLRHEPINTEAIFSITWDGFPYDVTIRAAMWEQSK